MTDYISREAAFNAVLKLVPKVDDDGYCWVIRGDAATAIDSIPAADVRPVEWIPVTERLPKESERVLVACEDGVSFGFFEEIIADDEFVKEWHDMMYYPISVTHWMPLPQAPKEE